MRLLPPGSLDGVASVELSLGAGEQPPPDPCVGLAADPHAGRIGWEELSGVYVGDVLAYYVRGEARIGVYAYVYDRARIECQVWEVALKAEMLASLVHEIAHHDDRTRRFARGRWIMENRALNERYAKRFQAEWTDRYVLPYVLDRYAIQVGELRAWFTALSEPAREELLHEPSNCSLCSVFLRLVEVPLDVR